MILQHIEQAILYEDNHLLIYNKRSSEIIQGDKTGDRPVSELLKDFIRERDKKPGNVFLGVVHRIDRPVSGAVIFAKTGKALTRLNEMLKAGKIHKTYWAVVTQPPPREEDHLVHYLVRNTTQNKSYASDHNKKDSIKAELRYELIGKSDRYYLLRIDLLTGRHHQIRSQLSKTGIPIKGDLKYGSPRSNPDGSIHLHSYKIEFLHPVRKEMLTIIAPPPDEQLWNFFAAQQGLSPSKS